jgi:N-acetylmuramoyl-L-alanine amidase
MRNRPLAVTLILMVMLALALPALAQTPTGVVTAGQLNVRTLPDPVDGVAIARVFQGQQFAIVGRDDTANWYQIQLPDGSVGWVSSAYFRVTNIAAVPVTNADYVQGRVLSQRLNLRQQPTTTARSLGQVSQGQVYRVVGKNADSSWFLLRLPTGVTGWVTARWLYVTNPDAVPVVSNSTDSGTVMVDAQASPVGITGTVVAAFLNIRTLPDPVEGIVLATASQGDVFPIVGRDPNGNWFQIAFSGTSGWVSSAYFRVSGDVNTIPVTFEGYVQGTVTASYLNIRDIPDPYTGRVLGRISKGQVYRVVGRSANGWYEIRLPSGVTGWVNGTFLSVSDPAAVPLK